MITVWLEYNKSNLSANYLTIYVVWKCYPKGIKYEVNCMNVFDLKLENNECLMKILTKWLYKNKINLSVNDLIVYFLWKLFQKDMDYIMS